VFVVKAILYITPRPDYYRVTVYLYNDEGKLVEKSVYRRVKHIVIEECTVRLSGQIVYNSIGVVVDAEKISTSLKGESILVVKGATTR